MYIIYFIRHLSTFINSRRFSLDSRLFLSTLVFFSRLSTFSLERSTFGFILLKLQRWIIEIYAYEKRFKCHKWQHWIVGSWKWRCEIYIGVAPHLFMNCWIKYTLGWNLGDWFRSGFVLNFQGFLLQRRCIFPKRRSLFYMGKWYYSRKMFVFPRKIAYFLGKATLSTDKLRVTAESGWPRAQLFWNPFCIVKVKSMWAVKC